MSKTNGLPEELEERYSQAKRSDDKKSIIKGLAGSVVIWLTYPLVNYAIPEFEFYTQIVFEILFVAFIGALGASYYQREKEVRDPNFRSFTWANYERARGLKLNNDAKELFMDKVREIPLTMEQAVEVHKIIQKELEEEKRPVEFVPQN